MLKDFLLPFTGLKEGKHTFSAKAEQAFFDCFENEDIATGSVDINFVLNKHSSFLELEISTKGGVKTFCDRCNDELTLQIEGSRNVVIKFGEAFLYEGDDLMVIPPSEHQIDTKQLVYENIIANIPLRKVHPKGACNQEAIDALKRLKTNETDIEQSADPRWDALKQLKK